MVLLQKISNQYVCRNTVNATILDVLNPASFILKESPGVNSSLEARNFAEAEESMQKYYESLEPSFFQMPLKDSIVVVLMQRKFYRAKVISILTMSAGHLFKVYLLDYGKECNVQRQCIFEIQKDFLVHPFQAVHFKLLGIEPVSLVMSSVDLSLSYGPVSDWDQSAERFINEMRKEMCNAYIETKATDSQHIYGSFFMNFEDGSVMCINDELIKKKYAYFNEKCWENVQSIETAIRNISSSVQNPEVSKSTTPQKPSSCVSEASPDMESQFKDMMKMAFIRPSDGKIVMESSLMNNDTKSPSKECDETIKTPLAAIPENIKKQPASLNRLLKLQKLRSRKSPSNAEQQSTDQSGSTNISPVKVEELYTDGIGNTLSKKTCVNENVYETSCENNVLNPIQSNTSTDSAFSLSNCPDASASKIPENSPNCISSDLKCELSTSNSHSVSEKSPQQENANSSSKVSPGSLNTLRKLQELKRKNFPSPEKSNLMQENAAIKSLNLSVSSLDNSDLLLTSPSQLNSSSTSFKTTPEKASISSASSPSSQTHPVNFQKVRAFFQKKKLSSSSSVSETQNKASIIENEKPKHAKSTVPHSDCDPSSSTASSKIKMVKRFSKSPPSVEQSQCQPSEDFIMCSSPKSRKDVFEDKKPDSEVTINTMLPKTVENVQKASNSKSLLESFDEMTMSPGKLESEVLKTLNEMSDSDDILYCVTKKKSESFSDDKSDVEESYIELCATVENFESKQVVDFSISLWEKQKIPALQLGNAIPSPALSIEAFEFSPRLRKVIKEIKFYGPSCIQSVVWPSMSRSRNLIAIAPPHSGKTVAYVMPLVSSFTEKLHMPKGKGPITIVLCSTWKKARAVNDLFRIFVGDAKVKILILYADGGNYKHKVTGLINGSDVLISTPHCLLQFLKTKSICFYRCKNFILDDGTNLINLHKKELKNILIHFMNGVKLKKVRPQLMICAERWNKNFQLIHDNLMSMPLLFFTSFLESAIFAQVPIVGHICDPCEKKKSLLAVLKDAGKVVICTTNTDDAVDVHHFLRCEDVKTYLVNEEMEHYIADEVLKDWKSVRCLTNSHCLVITDQALIKMCISSADCLVHYDVPHDSRLQFGNRFSCIAEHFQQKETSQKCVCHVFITKEDHEYASHLVDIIENSGGKVPEELKKMCNMQNKVEITSGPLCRYFKAFGFCKQLGCKYRHLIDPDLDKPQVVPCEGDIQGLVTHVIDASHYYVRVIKYIDPETKKTISLNSAYAKIGFQLKDLYSCITDDMVVDIPVVGKSYVMAEENTLFYRIKVLENVIPASLMELPKWKILFLDEGWIKSYEKLTLFKLPEHAELPKPLAVEVYVCNVVTPDSCLDWNPQSTRLVSAVIGGKEIHGKIALCLGETLWLDPIVLRTHFRDITDYVNLLKMNQKLVDCGHAKENKDHLKVLQEASSGKVPFPHIIKHSIKEVDINQEHSNISYAFLDCDVYEDVYVSSVVSPHQLYIQRAKFIECLDDLLEKINIQIEKRMLKKAFTLCKGMHCIAPFPEDSRYYRAAVIDISCDNTVKLFFVDFGDSGSASRSDVYCLPPEFLLLPFQAIECELAGIVPAHGGWTDSASNSLYDITRDEAGDMKILQLKPYSKTSCYRGGNHYIVDLWTNQKSVSLQLLEAGFGISAHIPVESSITDPDDGISEQFSDDSFNFDDMLSDQESNPEDKDAAALFCGVLSKMMLNASNRVPKTGVTITEVSSDDETPASICDKLKKKFFTLEQDVNVASFNPHEDCRKPLITWWDTPDQLNILINLKNVKVYHLDITDQGFNFNTVLAGIEYSTEEKFYAEVHSGKASTFQSVQGINIIFEKHTPLKWPRLVADETKFIHIKYDLIHIDDSDSEDINSDVKQNMKDDFRMDESSGSTDEDEKYVESWQKFAQNRNPYNFMG